MAKILYDDKVALNELPDIAEENKVTDDNMNEIKRVVNENYDELAGIMEIGNNSNGDYIKFSNGILICTKTVTGTTNITNNTMGGGMRYGVVNVGSYATPFISRPVVNVTLQNPTGTQAIISTTAGGSGPSASGFGSWSILRTDERSNYEYIIFATAIGRWK